MSDTADATIQFISSHEPPLAPGSYCLEVDQALSCSPGASVPPKVSRSFHFAVGGDRFRIKPALVHKVFPPASSQGIYDNVLPHVVLRRRTLPWERVADAKQPGASWLAVLVFSSAEAPPLVHGALADLYPSTTGDGDGALPSNILSYGTSTPAGAHFLEAGEKATDGCTYIDLLAPLFGAYLPCLDDLKWTAHARTRTDGEQSTDFAVVVATRLPTPGRTIVAHLVSLEGLGPYLPDPEGDLGKNLVCASGESFLYVRLVSLAQWTFMAAPVKPSFAGVLQALDTGTGADASLQLPGSITSSANATVQSTLLAGYTALSVDGSEEPSWYHGPFLSAPPPPNRSLPFSLPVDSSRELVAYDPKSGLEDDSYSAAWEIGRLIALADAAFATEQMAWKSDRRLELNVKARQQGKSLRDALQDPVWIQAALGISTDGSGLALAGSLLTTLRNLALLSGVPFPYLVPDSRMLPPESIRFFCIDPTWIEALLDGAWSLGRQPGSKVDDATRLAFRHLVCGRANEYLPVSGMMINSRLIPAYWPGIVFKPVFSLPTSSAASILREDRLSPTLVMLLFSGRLQQITITEPPEGLHFGFDMKYDSAGKPSGFEKTLRFIPTKPPTTPTTTPTSCTVPTREGEPGMVQLDVLRTQFATAGKHLTPTIPVDTAAELAFQLVETMPAVTFGPGKD